MDELVTFAKYIGPPGTVLVVFFFWWLKIVAPELANARADRREAENRGTVGNDLLLQVATTLKETAQINLRITERQERMSRGPTA